MTASSCTGCLLSTVSTRPRYRHTLGSEGKAWVSLQHKASRAEALTEPLGWQNRQLVTQTTRP